MQGLHSNIYTENCQMTTLIVNRQQTIVSNGAMPTLEADISAAGKSHVDQSQNNPIEGKQIPELYFKANIQFRMKRFIKQCFYRNTSNGRRVETAGCKYN